MAVELILVYDRRTLHESILLFHLILASCSLGAAQASIQKTGEYLKVRKQFGKSLDQFQVFRKKAFFWLLLMCCFSIYNFN